MILTGREADYFLAPAILIFFTPLWPALPGDAPFVVVEAATALVGVNLIRLRASLAPEDGLPLSSVFGVFSDEFTIVVAPDVFH